ncbi:adhesion protein [Alkalibacterium sp. MB6]|uniref:adhesion protein n=1 Tax=Alkalibacterium sp. MB6 TaxID=2081965 RepID=UPI00137A5AC9|nr:adhesion protein [Alkalibacterium sp. MB6]
MESLIFIVLMLAGHIIMMFIMPGMHGGHGQNGHDNHNENSDEITRLENENKELREELNVLKSTLQRTQR